MRVRKNISLVLALTFVAPSMLIAEEEIVFNGYPISKVESNSADSNRAEISSKDAVEYRVLITKRDGNYYWASRENRELIHITSGAFDWFISSASGYIKIVDRRILLEDENPKYLYMEHLTLSLSTITYWGAAESFNP